MIERLDVHQGEAVAQRPQDDRAKQRADDRALAAHQRGAADGRRGDGVQFPQIAERRVRRAEAADQDEARDRGEHAGDHIGGDLRPFDGNARDVGGFLVSANRKEVLSQRRLVEHDPHHQREEGHDDHRARNAER